MPLESTFNRPARRRRSRRVGAALFALALLTLSGCSAAGLISTTPDASPTTVARPTVARPTPRTVSSPAADANLPDIERVALTTTITAEGAPVNESSVVPQQPGQVFLCVQADNLEPNTTFRAVWFEAGQIIGQSDASPSPQAGDDGAHWIALSYRPVYGFKPDADHAVQLLVNGTTIDSYAFRVGVGDAKDVIAEAKLALGTDADNAPVGANTTFYVNVQQIVLWARISNEVDPTGMSFSTTWRRDNTVLAQLAPDGSQPSLPPTPTPQARRMTFTFVPQTPLSVGSYYVDLYLNGLPIATYPFTVSLVPPPTPTPAPTATPLPTATPTPRPPTPTPTPKHSTAQALDLVVADDVDSKTHQPIGDALFSLTGPPDDLVQPWIAVHVAQLSKNDTIELRFTQNGEDYATRELKASNLDDGWLAAHVKLDTPVEGAEPLIYTVSVYINGADAMDTTFQVSSE